MSRGEDNAERQRRGRTKGPLSRDEDAGTLVARFVGHPRIKPQRPASVSFLRPPLITAIAGVVRSRRSSSGKENSQNGSTEEDRDYLRSFISLSRYLRATGCAETKRRGLASYINLLDNLRAAHLWLTTAPASPIVFRVLSCLPFLVGRGSSVLCFGELKRSLAS